MCWSLCPVRLASYPACGLLKRLSCLGRWVVSVILALGWAVALADSTLIGELRFNDAAWQRASAEEEAQADGVILRRTGPIGPIIVTVPKHQPRLRVPEARFYQQLETVWRAAAGDALHLEWLEVNGRRWRVARRPSVEVPERVVFHLVSVVDGQAQHLLVSAPATVGVLPPAVRALLTGSPSTPMAAAAPTPAPVSSPSGQGAPQAAPSWRLDRALHVLPDAEAFDLLLRQEAERLPRDSGITGVSIAAQTHGFTATLSGFVQMPNTSGRRHRQGFSHSWDIAWEGPATDLPSGSRLALRPSRLPPGVGLQVSLRHYCGSLKELALVQRRLQHTVTGDLGDAMRRACAAIQAGRTQAEIIGSEAPARSVVFAVEPVPQEEDDHHLLVLSVRPYAVGEASGAALVGSVAVHYLYRLASQH